MFMCVRVCVCVFVTFKAITDRSFFLEFLEMIRQIIVLKVIVLIVGCERLDVRVVFIINWLLMFDNNPREKAVF